MLAVLYLLCRYQPAYHREALKTMLQTDKQTALDRFRQGLDISLAAADVFGNPSIMGLQALAIFLVRDGPVSLKIGHRICSADRLPPSVR